VKLALQVQQVPLALEILAPQAQQAQQAQQVILVQQVGQAPQAQQVILVQQVGQAPQALVIQDLQALQDQQGQGVVVQAQE
jgi:hypothetical protein